MTRRDAIEGATVYHSIFAHWGRGLILGTRDKDNLGYKTARKIKVRWEKQGDDPMWCRLSELRKTKR
jgi:hypothetical protein